MTTCPSAIRNANATADAVTPVLFTDAPEDRIRCDLALAKRLIGGQRQAIRSSIGRASVTAGMGGSPPGSLRSLLARAGARPASAVRLESSRRRSVAYDRGVAPRPEPECSPRTGRHRSGRPVDQAASRPDPSPIVSRLRSTLSMNCDLSSLVSATLVVMNRSWRGTPLRRAASPTPAFRTIALRGVEMAVADLESPLGWRRFRPRPCGQRFLARSSESVAS